MCDVMASNVVMFLCDVVAAVCSLLMCGSVE